MIAVLFADAGGVYSSLSSVEVWCKCRDARKYNGPYAVVAHPPCQRWGALARANFARYGKPELRPGNDHGCFASALRSVRRFGGVLEHPAKSMAFEAFSISKPVGIGWNAIGSNEYVCEVWQSAYGHKAAKATWLYYFGHSKPFDLKWDRSPGTHQIGFADKRGKLRNKPTLSRKQANATPLPFALELIRLAITSQLSPRRGGK